MMQVIEGLRVVADDIGESMANVALAWLLQQPGVTSVIMGGRNALQVQRNAAAANTILPREVIHALNTLSNELKNRMGPNADMWQATSRIQ